MQIHSPLTFWQTQSKWHKQVEENIPNKKTMKTGIFKMLLSFGDKQRKPQDRRASFLLIGPGEGNRSVSLTHQPAPTKQCCIYSSKQSSLLSSLILHARLLQLSSSRRVSLLEAVGCWWTVTTLSACLFFSSSIRLQSRHDRSATGFKPGQEEQRHQTTSCDHSYDCMLSWAAAHSPNDKHNCSIR